MTDETSRGDNTTAPESHSDSYNGWTNRETWAVALHINNDQGWQESVHEALRESLPLTCPDCGTLNNTRDFEGFQDCLDCGAAWKARAGFDAEQKAGDIIRENVEEMLTPDVTYWGDSHRTPDTVTLSEGQWLALQDIGSLWRVNWTELGAAFLSDLEDGEIR